MVWVLTAIVVTGITSSSPGTQHSEPLAVYRTERECNTASAKKYLERRFYAPRPSSERMVGLRCVQMTWDSFS